jgi:ribosomal protein S14
MQKASSELFQISVVFQKIKRDRSDHPRGFHGLFGLSRNVIRESASFGFITGLTKSSW